MRPARLEVCRTYGARGYFGLLRTQRLPFGFAQGRRAGLSSGAPTALQKRAKQGGLKSTLPQGRPRRERGGDGLKPDPTESRARWRGNRNSKPESQKQDGDLKFAATDPASSRECRCRRRLLAGSMRRVWVWRRRIWGLFGRFGVELNGGGVRRRR
jgi:hypothetical protein